MRTGNRSNVLLIELLIVILFFMLASTILVQVFGEAYARNAKAGASVHALTEVQSLADRIYMSEQPEELLDDLGFAAADEGGVFRKEYEDFQAEIRLETEERDGGLFRKGTVSAYYRDELLISLPCSRFCGE